MEKGCRCTSAQVAQNAIAGNNPIIVPAAPKTAAQIFIVNEDRIQFVLMNCGINAIYIGFGFAPDANNYSICLAAGQALDDGTGGVWVDDVWTGAVYAAAGGGVTGKLAATEEI